VRPAAAPAVEARSGDFPSMEARSGEFPTTESPSGEGKPPPPPLRKPQPPRRGDSSRPRPRRALKRPWWEDIFGEDFTRAVPRLSEKQVAREVDFIEESLGVAKGGVVLDLGCGAGHHAVDLAGRGYGVVGYDLSVYQLALAADVAQERDQKINFLHGDMREMAFDAMFDGIYCWNTTFGYFEEDKNIAVAERVFRALKPGGMFLLDVANRDFAATYSPSQLWYEGDSCVCMDDMSVDFITSRLRVKRSVIFDDGRSRECTYSIRLYSLHELGKLLHGVGFRVAEASGHPSTPGVFFGELSPRLIVLAQKP
jgi:SAM-dependent methyltransferase